MKEYLKLASFSSGMVGELILLDKDGAALTLFAPLEWEVAKGPIFACSLKQRNKNFKFNDCLRYLEFSGSEACDLVTQCLG